MKQTNNAQSEIKKITTRGNDKIEIIPFKFAGSINGYYLKVNGKEDLNKTFKSIKGAEEELKLLRFIW